MLHMAVTLTPLEILLQIVISQHLNESYCLTFVTEEPINFVLSQNFMNIVTNNTKGIFNQTLEVSERGCSDYLVRIKEPEEFMEIFEKVSQLGNTRRSDIKIVFLPFVDNKINSKKMLDVLSLPEASFVANLLLIIPSDQKAAGCKSYDLVTHQYVGPDVESTRPLHIDRWNSCSGTFDKNANLFPHDMSNLMEKSLKVACFTYKPYVLLDLDTSIEPLGRDGTEMRIVEEFCRYTF